MPFTISSARFPCSRIFGRVQIDVVQRLFDKLKLVRIDPVLLGNDEVAKIRQSANFRISAKLVTKFSGFLIS